MGVGWDSKSHLHGAATLTDVKDGSSNVYS